MEPRDDTEDCSARTDYGSELQNASQSHMPWQNMKLVCAQDLQLEAQDLQVPVVIDQLIGLGQDHQTIVASVMNTGHHIETTGTQAGAGLICSHHYQH